VPLQPKSGLGRLILEVSRSRAPLDTHTHTHTHTTDRVIGPSLRPLRELDTTNTTDVYRCPKQGSIPPSQQSIGRRLKLQTARPPASAKIHVHNTNMTCNDSPSPDEECRQSAKRDMYRQHARIQLTSQI
jgi:hypothetical protein